MKTLDDVKRVVGKGKTNQVIDQFIRSYLIGLAQKAWEESHAGTETEDLPGEPIEVTDADVEAWRVENYAMLRAGSYPPIGDQLDALWKGGDALEEMRGRVMAVKTKFKKP